MSVDSCTVLLILLNLPEMNVSYLQRTLYEGTEKPLSFENCFKVFFKVQIANVFDSYVLSNQCMSPVKALLCCSYVSLRGV